MNVELEADTYNAVGPVPDMYGHGPVTIIQEDAVRDRDTDEGSTLFVCLDCGYTTDDNRKLSGVACLRKRNGIYTSWRELLDQEAYPK